jgi:seryl-tRNA synthetase
MQICRRLERFHLFFRRISFVKGDSVIVDEELRGNEAGKNRFPHTLNGSGTALARLFVALVETYQQADGSLKLPEILAPYLGNLHIQPA